MVEETGVPDKQTIGLAKDGIKSKIRNLKFNAINDLETKQTQVSKSTVKPRNNATR